MINCKIFYGLLREKSVDFFTGVPDSLLKDFNAYVMDNSPSDRHIIAANEGGAIALASGYHLATGKIPLVYMQNSGQGNAINPLTSLADSEVYSIPMLLLIGWRGEPGVHDEPQHIKQGKVTIPILETLKIPFSTLSQDTQNVAAILEKAIETATQKNSPYALIVRKGTFEPYELQNKTKTSHELQREEAIKLVTNQIEVNDIVVSTTGMTSRELFEHRESSGQGHSRDFLTVGSMGHSSQIALGISLSKPARQVYCFDGDGAVIMHLGSLAIIGQNAPKNFKHVIFNNGAHDSVGGQPTVGFSIDFLKIAEACGYKTTFRAKTTEEIKKQIQQLKESDGPCMLEILVNKGHRKDLGRPTTTPIENKRAFMGNLSS